MRGEASIFALTKRKNTGTIGYRGGVKVAATNGMASPVFLGYTNYARSDDSPYRSFDLAMPRAVCCARDHYSRFAIASMAKSGVVSVYHRTRCQCHRSSKNPACAFHILLFITMLFPAGNLSWTSACPLLDPVRPTTQPLPLLSFKQNTMKPLYFNGPAVAARMLQALNERIAGHSTRITQRNYWADSQSHLAQ